MTTANSLVERIETQAIVLRIDEDKAGKDRRRKTALDLNYPFKNGFLDTCWP